MTKSLVVNCSLNGKINEDLLAALEKFSECSKVNFADISVDYALAKTLMHSSSVGLQPE